MARTRSKLTESQKKKRRREQKAQSMRKAREKLKQNPEALEEKRRKDREYYYRKKAEGKINTIKDLPDVKKKLLRNKWREDARRRREKVKIQKEAEKYIARETPPSSPVSNSVSSRAEMGARIAAKNRRHLKVENHLLKDKLKSLESKLTKYRMRLFRLQKKKQKDEKKSQKQKKKHGSNKDNKELRDDIQTFLLSDESSRLTAGKKETITRNKEKKQIRFLNDSLINLHKKYIVQTGKTISYKTFCRHRPFWLLDPKAAGRETCLCVTHTNMDYVAKALKNARVINENTAMEISKSICCANMTENCLERTCIECKQKKIVFNDYEPNDRIKYERWVTKKVCETVKGQKKMCQKTLKEIVYTSKRQLVNHLLDNIERFMQHTCNVLHQHVSVKNIKVAMSENEGLLHVDFSENYNCKYATEIQSAHFGGSKAQLSLHTSVFYYVDVTTEENRLVAKSFCTVSENRNHDPLSICTHLKPIIAAMKTLVPNLKRMHILSDGPSTQYRNKTMFHLIAAYLSEESNVDEIIWHYSESGHGKGAPDGVGGCLKRTADKYVAQGNDVHNLDTFMECVLQNCQVKNRAWRRAYILAVLIITVQTLSGHFAVVTYGSSILAGAGVTMDAELLSISFPAIMLVGSTVSIVVVEKIGRRVILGSSFIISVITLGCLATVLLLQHQGDSAPGWLSVLAIVASMFVYAFGILPVPYIVMTEMFNIQIRAKLLSLIVVKAWFLTFVLLFVFAPLTNAFGMYTTFYVFAGINLLGAAVVLVLMPETRGKSVEQIEAVLRNK